MGFALGHLPRERHPSYAASTFCRFRIFTLRIHGYLQASHNHSEQQMRGPVLCRRVSQGNRSRAGANAQAILMSLFRSMELHGRNPVDEVLRLAQTAIAGKPLVLPPSPDEADQIAA